MFVQMNFMLYRHKIKYLLSEDKPSARQNSTKTGQEFLHYKHSNVSQVMTKKIMSLSVTKYRRCTHSCPELQIKATERFLLFISNQKRRKEGKERKMYIFT